MLQQLMARRGEAKARCLLPFIPTDAASVLDLGGAEGHVGRALSRARGMAVTVADVARYDTRPLPFVALGGGDLPFQDDSFDVCVLSFVLHHAASPEGLLSEAARVTRQRILVLESVFRSDFDRASLYLLDGLANRIRRTAAVSAPPESIRHRTFADWHRLLSEHGRVSEARAFGRWPHHQALYALDLPSRPPGSTC